MSPPMTRRRYLQSLGPIVKNPFAIGAGLVFSGVLVSVVLPAILDMDRKWAPWLIMICWTPALVYADYLGSVRGMYITIGMWVIVGSRYLIWDLAAWLHLEKSFLHMAPEHRGWKWAVTAVCWAIGLYLAGAAHTWMNRRLAQRRNGGARAT